MPSKGKKLFSKASHLGAHIIYNLFILAKALWFFVWFFIYFHSLFEFFIKFFYINIVIFSILCFEPPKVIKEI